MQKLIIESKERPNEESIKKNYPVEEQEKLLELINETKVFIKEWLSDLDAQRDSNDSKDLSP